MPYRHTHLVCAYFCLLWAGIWHFWPSMFSQLAAQATDRNACPWGVRLCSGCCCLAAQAWTDSENRTRNGPSRCWVYASFCAFFRLLLQAWAFWMSAWPQRFCCRIDLGNIAMGAPLCATDWSLPKQEWPIFTSWRCVSGKNVRLHSGPI